MRLPKERYCRGPSDGQAAVTWLGCYSQLEGIDHQGSPRERHDCFQQVRLV